MKKFLYNTLFLLVLICSGHAYALTSGTTTTGAITSGGTSNQSFTGTAGQGIVLSAQSSSYVPVITIYRPDGSYWTNSNNRISATLPVTGTYNVVISATNSSASGAYSLAYVRGSDSVSNGVLTSGQSYNGTLATNGLESFQITGAAGQGIRLHADASYVPVITVYRPDGSYWNYSNNRIALNLPTTGIYTVVVWGSSVANSGAYRLDFARGSAGVSDGNLTSGQSYYGTLATDGLESFQFSGAAGQGIRLHADASYVPVIAVYRPDGSYLNYSNNRIALNLPDTGGQPPFQSPPFKLQFCGTGGMNEGAGA